jgi:sn-glycerol 3-phosphate transport system ATP-binding protein
MNAGRAEQIGSPMEVYQDPQTIFVAGFIGSPAMNFIAGKADGDGRIALDHGGSARSSRAALASGQPVTVGIRPEHFTACGERDATVSGPVEMVEQLGADALVHIGHGGKTIIARVSQGTSPEVGTTFCVTADPARVFAFDSTTGARVH